MWSLSGRGSADSRQCGGLPGRRHASRLSIGATIIFQPLLYQAATASLAPSEIAWPIRQLFRRRPDVTTLLAAVETIDKVSRGLVLDDGSNLAYDTLALATGARHAYFGHDDWEEFAPGLKTLDDATNIRGRILLAFEEAERELDERKQAALESAAFSRRTQIPVVPGTARRTGQIDPELPFEVGPMNSRYAPECGRIR